MGWPGLRRWELGWLFPLAGPRFVCPVVEWLCVRVFWFVLRLWVSLPLCYGNGQLLPDPVGFG